VGSGSVLHGLSEDGERVGRHLETQHTPARRREPSGVGHVAGSRARHDCLELALGLASCGLEPGLFGVGDHHPRQLARGAPAEGAGLERARYVGLLLEGFGDTELLLRGAGLVTEEPLDVLVEAAKAEMHVR
jgi:hypothetical protein